MTFGSGLRRGLMMAGLIVALTGCLGDDKLTWNAKDISGMLPDLEFTLTRTDGQTVSAEDYQGQVRLVFFGFTNCPDVCPATMARLSRAIKAMPEDLQGGVTPLFVSVDPQRDDLAHLEEYVSFFYDRTVGLTGDERALRQMVKRYRTTFGYDAPDERGNYNVSHSSAVYVFDQQGNARLLLRPEDSTDQITEDLTQLVKQARS